MEFLGLFLSKSDKKSPLYEQLYEWLIEEMRAGRLGPGEKLPGKRSAAAQLGVSVNTVDMAYQMLAAEGYVDARPRSGFVVNRLERQQVPPPAPGGILAPPPKADGEGEQTWRYSFSTADIDTAFFPRKTWNRLFREVLAGDDGLFDKGEPMGDEVLRRAVAAYLEGYRGVRCEAGQIACGAGLEVLVGMLARLLADRLVALEDPGYPRAAKILANVGVRMLRLPVDGAGIRPEDLTRSGARAAYLTPSHQFPTGAVMPVGRREALLRWARGTPSGGVLIEDDYDSEFRFDGRPLPSLQGIDEGGHVVYAGTFSRSLAPGIRAAYLVLPPPLLGRWQAAYGDYACTVSRPEQHTLARMLDEGHFARSLNRMRAAYKKRRGALLEALRAHMPEGEYALENTHTGLYCILRLPGLDAGEIAGVAREQGIRIRSLGSYRQEGGAVDDALVLGYGGLREQEIEDAVAALVEVIAQ